MNIFLLMEVTVCCNFFNLSAEGTVIDKDCISKVFVFFLNSQCFEAVQLSASN